MNSRDIRRARRQSPKRNPDALEALLRRSERGELDFGDWPLPAPLNHPINQRKERQQ